MEAVRIIKLFQFS